MRLYLLFVLLLMAHIPIAQVVRITGNGSCILDTVSSRLSILPTSFYRDNGSDTTTIAISQPGYFRIGNENRFFASKDTINLMLDSCRVLVGPFQTRSATTLFDHVQTQCNAMFNTLNNCNEKHKYKFAFETNVQPVFSAIDSMIHTNKEVQAADQLAIGRYFSVQKMMIVSAGVHSADSGLRRYAMQLLLEHTPTIEICAVGSGKFALMVMSRSLAQDWVVFRTWYNSLSKIDKLFVSILLVNAAEFSKSITLPKNAISVLRNEILKYHENLNSAEGDVLIAMKQKLSLSGKGINSMLGETKLLSITGLDISNAKLQPEGSDSAVLYFWATWCGPCIEFIKTHLANPAGKPKHIFISLDADEDKWKRMSQDLGIPDEINLQISRPFIESFRRKFNIESLPAKFTLTKNGFQF